MSVKVVIGAGFGDEGKGVTTDFLCSQDRLMTLVVRFSGGHQCGHKVIRDGKEHIFSNFGSGTLLGCPTYWSEYCTFEPIGFIREHDLLVQQGLTPKIYIHPNSPVTTPYDIYMGRKSIEAKHGSTGTGFKRTKVRHYEDGLQFTVNYQLSTSTANIIRKMEAIRDYYGNPPELDLDRFLEARFQMKCMLADGSLVIRDTVPQYEEYVFEGNQGLMLDPSIGHMPHCTPSDCTPRNVLKMGFKIDEVYVVTRGYQTRHGNGPMTNTAYPMILQNDEHETNVNNPYQGEFRKTALDVDQLNHAIAKGIDDVVPHGTKINLVMTCLDQMYEYRYTQEKVCCSVTSKESMARHVAAYLGIRTMSSHGDIYINTSPYADFMEKIT